MIDGQCRKCEQKALRVVGGNNECQIANLETIGSGWSCGFSRDDSRSGTIIAEGYFIVQDTGTYYFGPLHGGNNKYGNIDYLYLDIAGKRVFSTNGNGANNVSVRLEKGAHKLRYEAHVHKRTSIQFNYNTGSLCYPCDAGSLYKNGKCVCRTGYKEKNGTCVKETVCRNDDNNKVQNVRGNRWIWNGSLISITAKSVTSVDVGEYHYTTDGSGKICRSGR